MTIRQSIRDKGRLWIDAILRMEDTLVEITSIDGSRKIRPLRLVWLGPAKFLLSGVDERRRTQRVLVRFKTSEEAKGVAEMVESIFGVVAQSLPVQPEEIPVELRTTYSILLIVLAASRIGIGLLVLIGLVLLVVHGDVGYLGSLFVILILGYLFIPAFITLGLMRRRSTGWLKFETRTVTLRTRNDWNPMRSPTRISWTGPTSISYRSLGSKMELWFQSSTDALRAVALLHDRFPNMKEEKEIIGKSY